MKFNIEFQGDYYEDQDVIRIIIHANDMYLKINDALQEIRAILKYQEVSEIEETRLEKIRELLFLHWDK